MVSRGYWQSLVYAYCIAAYICEVISYYIHDKIIEPQSCSHNYAEEELRLETFNLQHVCIFYSSINI